MLFSIGRARDEGAAVKDSTYIVSPVEATFRRYSSNTVGIDSGCSLLYSAKYRTIKHCHFAQFIQG